MMKFDKQPSIEGKLIRLRPLESGDYDALFDVAKDPLIWLQHPSCDRYKPDVFQAFFQDSLNSKGAVVVIDQRTNQIIGSSRYKPHHSAPNAIEIGWSFLGRDYWGGRLNGAVKKIMIEHALVNLDFVVFYIAKGNKRSQRAVEKIGGRLVEGPNLIFLQSPNSDDLTYYIAKV